VGPGARLAGDVAATAIGGRVHLSRGVGLADGTVVFGDLVQIGPGSSIDQVATNQLKRNGRATVRGVRRVPPSSPSRSLLVRLPSVACGGPAIAVGKREVADDRAWRLRKRSCGRRGYAGARRRRPPVLRAADRSARFRGNGGGRFHRDRDRRPAPRRGRVSTWARPPATRCRRSTWPAMRGSRPGLASPRSWPHRRGIWPSARARRSRAASAPPACTSRGARRSTAPPARRAPRAPRSPGPDDHDARRPRRPRRARPAPRAPLHVHHRHDLLEHEHRAQHDVHVDDHDLAAVRQRGARPGRDLRRRQHVEPRRLPEHLRGGSLHAVTGTEVQAIVSFDSPGVPIAGLELFVDYPEGLLSYTSASPITGVTGLFRHRTTGTDSWSSALRRRGSTRRTSCWCGSGPARGRVPSTSGDFRCDVELAVDASPTPSGGHLCRHRTMNHA
jgi:hypothetical protein